MLIDDDRDCCVGVIGQSKALESRKKQRYLQVELGRMRTFLSWHAQLHQSLSSFPLNEPNFRQHPTLHYCIRNPVLRPRIPTPVVRNIARPVSEMFGHWIFRRIYR